MTVRVTEPGPALIKPPAIIDCGQRAVCKWYLVDEEEKFIQEEGELFFTGILTSFTLKLSHRGILKYLVMKILGKPQIVEGLSNLPTVN
jgi:hypothetical protein